MPSSITSLIQSFAAAVDQSPQFQNFYDFVWNLPTAQGFGLDILGKIVGVSRLLQVVPTGSFFGFYIAGEATQDWEPWSQAPFYAGASGEGAYELTDAAYRTLILVKAASNIAATTAPAINAILQTLFAGRGLCYVADIGNMTMQYVFTFPLTAVEFAIMTQANVPPHPAGAAVTIVQP
jgi:hypothetical protein